jgi:hypothetical protein
MKKISIMFFLFIVFFQGTIMCAMEMESIFDEPTVSLTMNIEKEPEETTLHPVWNAPTYLKVGASYVYHVQIKPVLKKIAAVLLTEENSDAQIKR